MFKIAKMKVDNLVVLTLLYSLIWIFLSHAMCKFVFKCNFNMLDQVESEVPVTCLGTNSQICFLALILLYFLKIKMILVQIPEKLPRDIQRGVEP